MLPRTVWAVNRVYQPPYRVAASKSDSASASSEEMIRRDVNNVLCSHAAMHALLQFRTLGVERLQAASRSYRATPLLHSMEVP